MNKNVVILVLLFLSCTCWMATLFVAQVTQIECESKYTHFIMENCPLSAVQKYNYTFDGLNMSSIINNGADNNEKSNRTS